MQMQTSWKEQNEPLKAIPFNILLASYDTVSLYWNSL
jgi:hypothetical protein